MKFTVETVDLRRALKAVAPHADPDPKFAQLHRLRLERGTQNVTVSATNRYTAGHALVSVWDQGDGELASFDLSPADVKELLTVFRGGSKSDEGVDDEMLEFDVDDAHVKVTDVSGLFVGKALTLPRYPTEDNFPNIAGLICDRLQRSNTRGDRLVTSGHLLGLFTAAAAAYKPWPLVIDPSGSEGSLLISCGESFVGMLMPQRVDDEQRAEIGRWHTSWVERLSEQLELAGT